MPKKLWGGRFKRKIDPDFERFSASLRWDCRLLPYDLRINKAQIRALSKCGLLKKGEALKLKRAVETLENRLEKNQFKLSDAYEDVHSAVQAELEKIVGSLAGKLHTGRSRNDLVSQSTRLYCKDKAAEMIKKIKALELVFLSKAQEYQSLLLPGMTHLQNAQVLSMGHIFLAYLEMLERAKLRLQSAMPFFDVCVLGSGALAGTTFNLDQELLARELGLKTITRNSYDVSGDRDFVADFLAAIVFIGSQLSRISEDLLIGQTKRFSVVDIHESFCTGSSMMPQKKNADFLELVRGAQGVFLGNFTGLMAMLKGLPTSYNRDLQWDKKFLFESVETCQTLLSIYIQLARTLKINAKKASEGLSDESLYATDLADYLVNKGLSFQEAHEAVGKIVSFSEETNVPVSKIGLDLLKAFSTLIEADVYDLFSPSNSVALKKTLGSTHPERVQKEIAAWKKRIR